jgi:endonuclease/exonuclease/phosphatase family metal-dependent hydrolase
MKILSYNLHHCVGTDGKVDYDRLAAVIKGADPDIVALQEVGRGTGKSGQMEQDGELARRLNMENRYSSSIETDGGEFGNAILSRFPIVEFTRHLLPGGDGHEVRSLAESVIDTGSVAGKIRFFCTHLDHLSEDLRMKQAAVLQKIAEKDLSLPMILAGDFNAEPGSPTLEFMQKTWADLSSPEGLLTFPSDPASSKIDYVLIQPKQSFTLKQVSVLDEVVASDHRALLVTLEKSS